MHHLSSLYFTLGCQGNHFLCYCTRP
uniref:Uncharacterized protein n=1 Tax=Anguilla anguilla TaxID=7936 RepID=A0A0E9Q9E0_ANGAN